MSSSPILISKAPGESPTRPEQCRLPNLSRTLASISVPPHRLPRLRISRSLSLAASTSSSTPRRSIRCRVPTANSPMHNGRKPSSSMSQAIIFSPAQTEWVFKDQGLPCRHGAHQFRKRGRAEERQRSLRHQQDGPQPLDPRTRRSSSVRMCASMALRLPLSSPAPPCSPAIA